MNRGLSGEHREKENRSAGWGELQVRMIAGVPVGRKQVVFWLGEAAVGSSM